MPQRLLPLLCCVLSTAQLAAAAPPKAVQIAPGRATLNGQLERVQLQVTGLTEGGTVDLTREVSYRNLTPHVIAVSRTGRVRPLANGVGRIRIEEQRPYGEVVVTVTGVSDEPAASFAADVVPIFSRAGCNAGACHSAQYGQGGLKLSLLGYAPEQDYAPLVRDRRQRRISRLQPADSLILRKATMQVGHGGGKRFDVGSYEFEVLRTWIAAGLPKPTVKEPAVVDLEVTPVERVYELKSTQQLRVVARYADGTTRDVTCAAMFDSLGDGVARVEESGLVTAVGPGQAAIMVRYRGQAKVSHVIAPFAKDVDLTGFKPHNFVDENVKARWQRLGVQPAELCSDEVFIRRAYLDAIGTLPKPARVEAFLKSRAADKREQLVDELLGLTGDSARDVFVNEWSAYWALKWGDLLRNNRNKLGDGGMWAFYNWIRGSLRGNKPVDQLTREILTAQGSIFKNGPANFYRIATRPEDLAETTAQVFLGVRLQCAKCHHHPFEVYSQADYYSLAAFFTRVSTKSSRDFGALGGDSVVTIKRSGSIRHPRTRKTMPPKPLLADIVDAAKYNDLRRPLAEWLTSPKNALFARNIVNRVWGYLMGTGLVEPIDDMRATNPASNPELLDALAADFVKSGYDLRKLMRAIMTSRVYQLSSTPRPENARDTRFYLHYNAKKIPAEVLLDAIDFACGTQERFRGVPLGTRAIELPDSNYASYFLDTMGRPKRVIACECERTSEPNLAQVLHIANGSLMQAKLIDKNGRLAKLLKAKKTDEEIIRELYLVTMSRPASAEEQVLCKQIIAEADNRREGVEDILWSLCNSREFLLNH